MISNLLVFGSYIISKFISRSHMSCGKKSGLQKIAGKFCVEWCGRDAESLGWVTDTWQHVRSYKATSRIIAWAWRVPLLHDKKCQEVSRLVWRENVIHWSLCFNSLEFWHFRISFRRGWQLPEAIIIYLCFSNSELMIESNASIQYIPISPFIVYGILLQWWRFIC